MPAGTATVSATAFALTVLFAASAKAEEIPRSAREAAPLEAGRKIPDVEVRTVEGKAVRLAEVLKGRKSILIVYRGGWCPFCTRHLTGLQAVKSDSQDLGYTVYALAPDTAESVRAAAAKGEFDFTPDLHPLPALSTCYLHCLNLPPHSRDRQTFLLSIAGAAD